MLENTDSEFLHNMGPFLKEDKMFLLDLHFLPEMMQLSNGWIKKSSKTVKIVSVGRLITAAL